VTVSLRNKSGEPQHLGNPALGSRLVDVDEVIHVEGDLAPAKQQPDDAYLIGSGDDARLWPKSVWTNAGGSPKAEPDVPAPTAEEK
jgi:hypothetical protein